MRGRQNPLTAQKPRRAMGIKTKEFFVHPYFKTRGVTSAFVNNKTTQEQLEFFAKLLETQKPNTQGNYSDQKRSSYLLLNGQIKVWVERHFQKDEQTRIEFRVEKKVGKNYTDITRKPNILHHDLRTFLNKLAIQQSFKNKN